MNTQSTNPISVHLKWVAQYHGPNPYAAAAVIVCELTADCLPDTQQIRLAATQLWTHCGMQRAHGEELAESLEGDELLALGHAAAHWAKAALNEVRGFVQHAGAQRAGNVVKLWVGFHHAKLSQAALQLALQSLLGATQGLIDWEKFKTDLLNLWQGCRRYHLDYQARILMVGAREMGVPYLPFLAGTKYWQFGWGAKARVFMESSSNTDGALGWQWQKNKVTAKALMSSLGFPTPAHTLVMHKTDLPAALTRVGMPCVIKPLDSGGGKGVTANIRTLAEATIAFEAVQRLSQGAVLVEAHIEGSDHRLMVIDGKLVAAIRREPSFVIGDGMTSIFEFVNQLNESRSTNMVRSRYLRPIAVDEVLHRHLATQGLALKDIPAAGRRVSLRSNANLSTGGICTDVTSILHPQVQAMAELLAKASGIATIGIDYLTMDITRPANETGGTFIEMNTTPGMDACIAAGWSEGSIARLALGGAIGRIPLRLAVIDASGMRALEGIAGEGVRHERVSKSLAGGIARVIGNRLYLGELVLQVEPTEPWAALAAALRHQNVFQVELICSAEELQRHGSPVDRLDQACVAVFDGKPVLPEAWLSVIAEQLSDELEFAPQEEILSSFV